MFEYNRSVLDSASECMETDCLHKQWSGMVYGAMRGKRVRVSKSYHLQ